MNKPRLIDANELIEDINAIHYTCTGMRAGKVALSKFAEQYRADILKTIDEQPSVDAVEVVRCEDCMLRNKCSTEDVFTVTGIKNPFCCAGKKVK